MLQYGENNMLMRKSGTAAKRALKCGGVGGECFLRWILRIEGKNWDVCYLVMPSDQCGQGSKPKKKA